MAFIIKRNDLRPNIQAQLFEADGSTPLNLEEALAVNFVMRAQDSDPNNPPRIKRPCEIANAPQGRIVFKWQEGDTIEEGKFYYEFEVIWPGVQPQTIPVDGYLELTIVRDLG